MLILYVQIWNVGYLGPLWTISPASFFQTGTTLNQQGFEEGESLHLFLGR
ncbi:hypothetical protein Scep_014316 [Stephania cephalantha]|uniref:Uncharacterized protein n=1 Tax=Stephania cephalantha TaxID=152367 RepID=A0AAP0P1J7_9MAGN